MQKLRHSVLSSCLLILGCLGCFGSIAPTPAQAEAPEQVSLTWMSIANWLIEVGETRIVMDGYITRIPETAFSGPSFAYGEPSVPDTAGIQRVMKALGSPKIDFILTGHSHFDFLADLENRASPPSPASKSKRKTASASSTSKSNRAQGKKKGAR